MAHTQPHQARPGDLWAGAVVLGLGICLLFLAVTGTVFRYVQPGFRPWVGVSGVLLIALSLWTFVAVSRDRGMGTPSRAGWLLLVPVLLVSLVLPGALAASTARTGERAGAGVGASISAEEFEPFGPGVNDTTVRELVERHDVGQDMSGARVRLVGMVQPADGGWVLTRFRIICCAADAIAYSVPLTGAVPRLAPGSWAEVSGVVEDSPELRLRAHGVVGVRQPERPYQ